MRLSFMRSIVSSGLIILGATATLVRADDKADVQAAVSKLADSDSYSWTTNVEGGFGAGTTTGKTQKDGFTTTTLNLRDNSYDVVIQGSKCAIKTPDGWKSAGEILAAADDGGGGFDPDRFAARIAQNLQAPGAQAKELVDQLADIKKTDDSYTADLTADQAKELLTFRRRRNSNFPPPQVANQKGTVKYWIKNGVLTKTQVHVTGTVTFNDNDNDVDRTTTVDFNDIGSTKIDVPAEARAKLLADKPAPPPAAPAAAPTTAPAA
jgi:hypothetical protein